MDIQKGTLPLKLHGTHRPGATFADLLLDDTEMARVEVKRILAMPGDEVTVEIVARLKELSSYLLNEFLTKDTASKSERTWIALNSSWNVYSKWCESIGTMALPSSSVTFMQFVDANASRVKNSTMALYKWAVSTIHNAVGLPDPTSTMAAKRKLEATRKLKILKRQSDIKQAVPFRYEHLNGCFEKLYDATNLKSIRDLAVVSIAYETMLRESELTRAKFSDLYMSHEGKPCLFVPFTKTDKSGDGVIKRLSRRTWNLLELYRTSTNSSEADFIIQGIHHRSKRRIVQSEPMSGRNIDNIFRSLQERLRCIAPDLIPDKFWSGHSCRVGACQDLLGAGFSIPQIQQSGGWLNPMMIMRYGHDILADESAMTQFIEPESARP